MGATVKGEGEGEGEDTSAGENEYHKICRDPVQTTPAASEAGSGLARRVRGEGLEFRLGFGRLVCTFSR